MTWHVFYTRALAEAAAGEAIADLGYQVFIPMERRTQRLPNRKPTIGEYALFPRYGFVQLSVESDPWGKILEAKGVIDILRSELRPIPVPDRSIDALQVAQKCGLFDRTKKPEIKPGMRVEITSGPFATLIGKVIKARTADRLDVLLKFLNADCHATIPLIAMREIA